MLETKILTDLEVDDPVQLVADYMLDTADRRYQDQQMRGVQQHLVDCLIKGALCSWFVLDSSSAPLTAGDVFCVSPSDNTGRTVTRADVNALAAAGRALGVAMTAVTAGGKFRGALGGVVPSSVTGLAAGAPGPVRASGTTYRAERKYALNPGDYPLGYVDNLGNLSLSPQLEVHDALWTPLGLSSIDAWFGPRLGSRHGMIVEDGIPSLITDLPVLGPMGGTISQTGAARPELDAVGGRAGAKFDGAADYMVASTAASAWKKYHDKGTIGLLCHPTAAGPLLTTLDNHLATNIGFNLYAEASGDLTVGIANGSGTWRRNSTTGGTALALNNTHCVVVRFDENQSPMFDVRVDGVTKIQSTMNGSASPNDPDGALHVARYVTTTAYLAGFVGEAVFCNEYISAGDTRDLEAFLLRA